MVFHGHGEVSHADERDAAVVAVGPQRFPRCARRGLSFSCASVALRQRVFFNPVERNSGCCVHRSQDTPPNRRLERTAEKRAAARRQPFMPPDMNDAAADTLRGEALRVPSLASFTPRGSSLSG
jgi:hypothetical protein